MQNTKNLENNNIEKLPDYCDYLCQYAAFTDPKEIKACTNDVVVFCKKFNKYNNKNKKCLGKK